MRRRKKVLHIYNKYLLLKMIILIVAIFIFWRKITVPVNGHYICTYDIIQTKVYTYVQLFINKAPSADRIINHLRRRSILHNLIRAGWGLHHSSQPKLVKMRFSSTTHVRFVTVQRIAVQLECNLSHKCSNHKKERLYDLYVQLKDKSRKTCYSLSEKIILVYT
jgi:hypothetical protein